MPQAIPESHRDLLAGPVNVVLTTVMPDGQPQTTPVWCNLDGDDVLFNTMRQFRKHKNMRLDPKVTLLAYRLNEPLCNIEVRGRVVEMTEEGALDHLNQLNLLYDAGPGDRDHPGGRCPPRRQTDPGLQQQRQTTLLW